MAAIAGILNHQYSAGQSLAASGAIPLGSTANGAASASNSDTNAAKISANDFLTLLVTEMRNQDPTANSDPNQYVNQLVQVNSLQQLISINETLTSSLSSPTADATGSSGATGNPKVALFASPPDASTTFSAGAGSTHATAAGHAPGNLSIPSAKPAAYSVAHALDGHSHLQTSGLPGTK